VAWGGVEGTRGSGAGRGEGDGGDDEDALEDSGRKLSQARIDLDMLLHHKAKAKTTKNKAIAFGALGSRSESRDRRPPRADNKIRIAPSLSRGGSTAGGSSSMAGSFVDGFVNRGASFYGVAAESAAGATKALEARGVLDSYEAVELLTGKESHLGGGGLGTRNVVLSPMFLLRTWSGPQGDLLQSAKFLRRMERYLGIKGIVLVRLEAQDPSVETGYLQPALGGVGAGGQMAMV